MTTESNLSLLDPKDFCYYPKALYKYKDCSKNHNFEMLEQQYLWAAEPDESPDKADSLVRFNYGKICMSKVVVFLIMYFAEKAHRFIAFNEMNVEKYYVNSYEYQKAQTALCLTCQYAERTKNQKIIPLADIMQKYLDSYFDVCKQLQGQKLIDEIQQHFEKSATFLQRKSKICCLTTRKNNAKMWEDYADKYSGFVIEYNLQNHSCKELLRYLPCLFPVSYLSNDNIPLLDGWDWYCQEVLQKLGYHMDTTKYKTDVLRYLLIKNIDYQSEEEWRFLSKESKIFFPTINNVYIGHNCSKQNQDRILSICKKNNIPVYKQKWDKNGEISFDLIYPKYQ